GFLRHLPHLSVVRPEQLAGLLPLSPRQDQVVEQLLAARLPGLAALAAFPALEAALAVATGRLAGCRRGEDQCQPEQDAAEDFHATHVVAPRYRGEGVAARGPA